MFMLRITMKMTWCGNKCRPGRFNLIIFHLDQEYDGDTAMRGGAAEHCMVLYVLIPILCPCNRSGDVSCNTEGNACSSGNPEHGNLS